MENETAVVLTVVAGSMIMLLLLISVVFFGIAYNRKFREQKSTHLLEIRNKELELLKAVIRSQEDEREKLAANLHDEVGPLASALKLRLTLYDQKLKKNILESSELHQEIRSVDEIIDNIRTVSHNLSPHFINKFGLHSAVKMFTDKMTPEVEFEGQESLPAELEKQLSANLYRILMELINNISRYDYSDHIKIVYSYSPDCLKIILSHDGNGLTDEEFDAFYESSNGLGLASIKSRLIIINAKLVMKRKGEIGEKAGFILSAPITTS